MNSGIERITHRMPPPTTCDVCKSPKVQLISIETLIKREFDYWPLIYKCFNCGASVGCHRGTSIPFGRMASKRIRAKRQRLHDTFDKFWQSRYMDRSEAYIWLAEKLEIPADDCHIAWLTESQLFDAICIVEQEWLVIEKIVNRRKEKYRDKRIRQSSKQQRKIELRKNQSKFFSGKKAGRYPDSGRY